MEKEKNSNYWKIISQVSVVLIVLFLAIGHQLFGVEKFASIDAYCPFGALENAMTYLVSGTFFNRVFVSSFLLFAIFFGITIIFGRVFCSYFCPLGAIQEWIRSLGKKIGIRKDVELPESIDKYARYMKYVLLVGIMYFSFRVGDLFFRNYDPYNALMHLGNELDEKIFAYLILGVVVFASLFSSRWWCRYFCPLGAFLGIVKKIGLTKIHRDKTTCVDCSKCDSVCPSRLKIKNVEKVVSADCLSCGKCVSSCPQKSLNFEIFGSKISQKKFVSVFLVVSVIALVGVIASPVWKTSPASNIVNDKGAVNVENLRGSNTLGYVLEMTGIPYSVFKQELGLPEKDALDMGIKLKDIGPKFDIKNKEGEFIETEDFREVIGAELERSK